MNQVSVLKTGKYNSYIYLSERRLYELTPLALQTKPRFATGNGFQQKC